MKNRLFYERKDCLYYIRENLFCFVFNKDNPAFERVLEQ